MARIGSSLLCAAFVVVGMMAKAIDGLTVPRIIQGGMGIRISNWKLARSVAEVGQLGIVSGTVMDTMLVRELQDGDKAGDVRRALAAFPDQDMVDRIMDKYFIEGGKDENKPYKNLPMWTTTPPQGLLEATILANFIEVWLAKHDDEGNLLDGIVGINLLTKVELPNIPSLYGAMLGGVDYVIMGAGIPMQIPGILDSLSEAEDCSLDITTAGVPKDQPNPALHFSPKGFWEAAGKPEMAKNIDRPAFLPIVSSVVLAKSMLKRATGKGPTKGIQGFIIELNTAGGHNAPPRGFRYDPVAKSHALELNERGEPVYGPKDYPDLKQFAKATNGMPFWLAGSYAKPERFQEVIEMGGTGVQVGSIFSLCQESGLKDDIKADILRQINDGDLQIFTDPVASPTGFPFKVLELGDSLSEEKKYEERPRVCNLGYLRTAYMKDDGKVGYRCPSEPIKDWLKKGGEMEATEGRKCLCNALAANAGFPQVSPHKKDGETERYIEEILITCGDDVNSARRFMEQDEETGVWSYSAKAVVEYLLSEFDGAKSLVEGEEAAVAA